MMDLVMPDGTLIIPSQFWGSKKRAPISGWHNSWLVSPRLYNSLYKAAVMDVARQRKVFDAQKAAVS